MEQTQENVNSCHFEPYCLGPWQKKKWPLWMYHWHQTLPNLASISQNYLNKLLQVGSALFDVVVLNVLKEYLKPSDKWHICYVHLQGITTIPHVNCGPQLYQRIDFEPNCREELFLVFSHIPDWNDRGGMVRRYISPRPLLFYPEQQLESRIRMWKLAYYTT